MVHRKTPGCRTIQILNFPVDSTAEEIKKYLERRTEKGSVYALKIREQKTNGEAKVYAIVQFTATRFSDDIADKKRLLFRKKYSLRVMYMERDIVPKPKSLMTYLDNVTLHLGCQVSDNEFSVLWSASNVSVSFSPGLQKLEFSLSYGGHQYKLDLYYGSIWQMQLRHPHGKDKKYLLIQLRAAPRIYKKNSCSSGEIYDNPLLNYFRHTPDEQWIRAVDFTPSCCIGQSPVLCLEFKKKVRLPDIRENFFYYKETADDFILRNCSAYSNSLNLVPIVESSEIPYTILFKVNTLVQNGIIMGTTLDDEFYSLVDPCLNQTTYIECGLESLSQLKDTCFEPAKYLRKQYEFYGTHDPKSTAITLESGLVYVRRIQVTPSKVYFCGPEVNVSNRVLRNYPLDLDNFLRISFVDEDSERIRSMDLVPRSTLEDNEKHTDVYKRFLSTLKEGIIIGDKKFEFLAFSSSQLRENSAWMFAPKNGLSADGIREWMGDFSAIRNVAKYAARLGQSFGSSKEGLTVGSHEIEVIPDVEIVYSGLLKSTKYNFSDGIGKISDEFANEVAIKCGITSSTPSAFQIRIGGCKGVVAVDPLSKYKLSLRNSMCKYKSDETKLDVLSWSKYQPCFLNRQLITLLSTLGVEDYVFEMKQEKAVRQLNMILTDPIKAQEALEVMSPGEHTKVLKEMLKCGYKPDSEPFLSMMLQTFRASKLVDLKMKARIFVSEGRVMMGCLDETRTLEYGQVFVKASRVRPGERGIFEYEGMKMGKGSFVVEGKVIVAKNPCLHPGDIRVLEAVDVPALHHMVDCVVFPRKGKRPHPNECSGSDLDGDTYFVSWDSELIPPRQISPMDYDASPPQVLDHEVSIEEVEEYFTNYMVNDNLGVISNAHTVFADKEAQMAESKACLELANLFSIAVDFPKTGIPAEIPPRLQVKEYPDFMEKPNKPTYKSTRVIGKLYRAVKDISSQADHIESITMEVTRRSYDRDMEFYGFEDYVRDADNYKCQYNMKLYNLMDHYGIKTEAEIISGSIMTLSKAFTKKKGIEDNIGHAVRCLKKEARGWFDEKGTQTDQDVADDVYAKASAWYHVTYHPDYCKPYNEERIDRPHLLSFAWVVYDMLITIKQKKMLAHASLNEDFGGVNLKLV